jgi:ribonuclease E
MAKKMLIDATHPEETRVVVADGNKVEEFDFESLNKRQIAGNIYLAKVTRVEPSLQAAFVEYGGNRHGFLAFPEIHPDYYQIPKADRDAILAEERALAREQAAADDASDAAAESAAEAEEGPEEADAAEAPKKSRGRSRTRSRSKKKADATSGDETAAGGGDAELAPGGHGAEIGNVDPAAQAEGGEDVVSGSRPELSEAAESLPAPGDADEDDGEDDRPTTIAESAGLEDGEVSSDASGGDDGDVVDAPEEDAGIVAVPEDERAADKPRRERSRSRRKLASEEASEDDEALEVETVADDDTEEEIRQQPRPQRAKMRKYKIQEVVKVRQIMLVQVVKEERGNKGAALTTYLSLAGRYCVLMPNTARGGGISRKITNAADRKKLKEIAAEIDVPQGAGLIIRTAGAKRTKTEIKRDYEYLQRQWEQVRELTLKSIAPAPIYEEGNLINRSIRDYYTRDIDEVIVDGEAGFREAKDYMRLIMPSHAKSVKLHEGPQPLFAKHGVESYLSSMFNPTVQLPSGGYIVIGVTEALVAVDVNSGKATKEGSIEETALKTNLEAADEVARQAKLRDLAGLIVIDFIDMDERRNNAAVEKRLKDALKTDRARIQVGRISSFGLLEMSRQRLRPGMLEATTQACPHCHGTGLIRSDDSVALMVLRSLEEEGGRKRSREVLARLPVKVANYLMNEKREHLADIEQRYEMAVRIEADPSLLGDEFPPFEKFKTSTRTIPKPVAKVVGTDTSWVSDQDDEVEELDEEDQEEIAAEPEASPEPDGARGDAPPEAARPDGEEGQPRKKRRRRSRRRKSGGNGGDEAAASETQSEAELRDRPDGASDPEVPPTEGTPETTREDAPDAPQATEAEAEAAPKKSRSRTRSRRKATTEAAPEAADEPTGDPAPAEPAAEIAEPVESAPETEAKAGSKRRMRAKAPAPSTDAPSEPLVEAAEAAQAATEAGAVDAPTEPEPEPEPAEAADASSEEDKPRKRGWWAFGR